MSNKAKYAELIERQAALQKELQETGKDFFSEELRSLFDVHGQIHSIAWRQYTPYFNDGDECTFSVYNDDLDIEVITATGDIELFEYMSWYQSTDSESELPVEKAAAKDFIPFLQAFEDDLMHTMFGNHVKITAYRDGKIEIEEYDHD